MSTQTRNCTVLIVDIAGSVALRTDQGDAEATRCVRALLERIIGVLRDNGGTFVKSDGDDVLATFEGVDQGIAAAADTAIETQRVAQAADLQLYAGLCAGPVEFGHTLGYPVALGQTVNLAARLHKLTENVPGRIFLPRDLAEKLPADLHALAARFGPRMLKGWGEMDIWTLEWRELNPTRTHVPTQTGWRTVRAADCKLEHAGKVQRLSEGAGAALLGRGADCTLRVVDPDARVSSRHLILECEHGRWTARDVSRNGAWLHDAATLEVQRLAPGVRSALPRAGVLCLGRPFAEDPQRRFQVVFDCGGSAASSRR